MLLITRFNLLYTFCLLFAGGLLAFAEIQKPYVSFCQFSGPEGETYVEASFLISGKGLKHELISEGNYSASVLIQSEFQKVELETETSSSQLASACSENVEAQLLSTQGIKDETGRSTSFLYLVRQKLDSGNYIFSVCLEDGNNPAGEKESYTYKHEIKEAKEGLYLSDFQLLEKIKAKQEGERENLYDKQGFTLTQNPISYYPAHLNKLAFYGEIYNSHTHFEDSIFLINYSIVDGDGKRLPEFRKFKKQRIANIVPLMAEMNIDKLYSGNYGLVIELFNQQNILQYRRTYEFQRNNKKPEEDFSELSQIDIRLTFVDKMEQDEVEFHISCLEPISSDQQNSFAKTLKKSKNLSLQKRFLYNYWLDREPLDPFKGFEDYRALVHSVEKEFGTGTSLGFETDRGRMFLKYGPPNDVEIARREPNAVPYEVWKYYSFDRANTVKKQPQTNVDFIFYNPSLVPNEFVLIHSTHLDELHNDRWRLLVFKDQDNEFDQKGVRDHYGTRQSDFK